MHCVITKDYEGKPYYWNENLGEWVRDKYEATIYVCAEAIGEVSYARKLARQLNAVLEPLDMPGI
jgi:hypothetical protein